MLGYVDKNATQPHGVFSGIIGKDLASCIVSAVDFKMVQGSVLSYINSSKLSDDQRYLQNRYHCTIWTMYR